MTNRWLPGVLASAALLTACGVSSQESPVEIRPGEIPTQLRGDAGAATHTPVTPEPGRSAVLVQFVRNDRLVGLTRQAPVSPPEARLESVVGALVNGPTEGEQARGFASALPPGLTVRVVSTEGERVVLELGGESDGQSATENVLAVGQIVLSVTSVENISQVSFSRDGVPVEALLADGALTTKPLTAADYADLRAR
jgi:spore germination protein GerM